jgi:MFS transporter, SP family, arabinose:H+ symporter
VAQAGISALAQKVNLPRGRGSKVYLGGVCVIAALGGLLFGYDTAVINGTNQLLKSQFAMSSMVEGCLVASALLGCIIGALLAGKLSDSFGRKKILLLSGVLFLGCAIGCTLAGSVMQIILWRLVGGVGVGIASMLSPLYIAEFTPPHLRGRMVTLYQFAITAGIMAAFLSNALILRLSTLPAMSKTHGWVKWLLVDEVWRSMFGAMGLPALLFFAFLWLVPESPRWLAKQGRTSESLLILALVGGEEIAQLEMAEIQDALANETGRLSELFAPGMRIALLIGIMIPIFSQVTGINTIIYYGTSILEKAGFARGSSFRIQAFLGVVPMLACLVAIWTVDRLGRRPLLLFGAVSVLLALVGMALFFNTGSRLLVLFICLHIGCFNISFGPIAWVLISEIFPTRIRGRAMSIGTFSIWITCCLVALTFPLLRDTFGARSFWIYAALVAPSVWFIWRYVPETKNRTLEQIEKQWIHSRPR